MIKWVFATAVLALTAGCAVQTGPEESTENTGEAMSIVAHTPGSVANAPTPYMGGPVAVRAPAPPSIATHVVGHIHIVPLTPDPPPSPEGAGSEDPGDAPEGLQHIHAYAHPGATSPNNGTQHIHVVPLTPDPPPEPTSPEAL